MVDFGGGSGVLGDCGRGKQGKNTKACEMGMSVSQSLRLQTEHTEKNQLCCTQILQFKIWEFRNKVFIDMIIDSLVIFF